MQNQKTITQVAKKSVRKTRKTTPVAPRTPVAIARKRVFKPLEVEYIDWKAVLK